VTGHGAFKAPPPTGGSRFSRPDWLDMKALIAIVIGLVSFTGALLTWRASTLSSNATGADRQSVLETVVQQQNSVSVETQLRFEEAAFARFKADMVNAQKMRAEATQLRNGGLKGQADQLEDDATRLENLALVAARDTGNAYSYDENGVPTFDEAGRRLALSRKDEAASQANPEQQVKFADQTRKRSQRLVGFLPILVLAIVLLTIAQLLRRDSLRPFLAGAGTLIWLVAIVIAFVGDKG
jgi:hypothetical protein